MIAHFRHCSRSLVIAGLCLPLWVSAEVVWTPARGSDEFSTRELRKAVQAHRALDREEFQRDDNWGVRRLTTLELAQLREQVRQQWPGRTAPPAPADSRSAEHMASTPVSGTIASQRNLPAASQRP